MKGVHAFVLIVFLALVGFLAWLGQRGDNDEKVYIGLIGTLLVFGLIGFFGALARGQNESNQKMYSTAIGTLVGLVGGLLGGVAIGNQAGQTAADDVKDEVAAQVQATQTTPDSTPTSTDTSTTPTPAPPASR